MSSGGAGSGAGGGAARKSKGRQKIEMKKMSNESNLQVTFSKRRSGLFKKASELCTLCGAEVAIIVFSPGEKVFSFGHPNVDSVIERYLTRAPQTNSGTLQFIEAHRSANVRDLNGQLTQINNHLDVERKRSDELTRLRRTTMTHFWWASPIEGLSKPHLEQLKTALDELKKSVTRHADRLLIQGAAVPNSIHFFGASPSNAMVAPPAPAPAPAAQLFPPPQMIQPPAAAGMMQMQMQNPAMYDGNNMMRHHAGGFNLNNNNNNMGGFGFF